MSSFWKGLGRGARAGLIGGVAAIVAVTVLAGYWVVHPEYDVLFADLTPQDAVAMTGELERLKIPFTLAEEASGGTTIRVEKKDVYSTRIKLMGKDLPLHGAVGFELFNNSDFGMTEFAQKINYQRALQGELTRTILSLSEIRDARVLLALPEQGLFKQATSKAKASITLALKYGQALRPEQVAGIQRLVAAAVPGIATQDVTLVDQSGVALSRSSPDGVGDGASGPLELKRDTESYLARKATEVLERALGSGQAIASVDVTLDLDRVQSTTEAVMAAPGQEGRDRTGVVVRQRVVRREPAAPLASKSATDGGAASTGESSQREVEYAVGRRVEQIVGQPGSIRRLHVVAIVKTPLDPRQLDEIRGMVAASVGASPERGDTVVVQNFPGAASPDPAGRSASLAMAEAPASREPAASGRRPPSAPIRFLAEARVWLLALAGAAGGALLTAVLRRKPARHGAPPPSRGQELSEADREAVLSQVTTWLRGGDATPTRGGGAP